MGGRDAAVQQYLALWIGKSPQRFTHFEMRKRVWSVPAKKIWASSSDTELFVPYHLTQYMTDVLRYHLDMPLSMASADDDLQVKWHTFTVTLLYQPQEIRMYHMRWVILHAFG